MISNEILEKAFLFAIKKHAGQKRKGNKTPYILHPMRVAGILYEVKKSSNTNFIAAVCLLHDTVEDCNVTIKQISRLFGFNVAGCVEELTTDKAECERMGKAEYLLQKMVKMSSYSLCVKLADRLDNVRDMQLLSKETQQRVIKETNFILNHLLEKRKVSVTHRKLIGLIFSEMEKYCYK